MGRLLDLPDISALTSADSLRDFICIRGVRLPLGELVNPDFLVPGRQAELRRQMLAAAPFPHLVVEGLFHPRLLELVAEEFAMLPAENWTHVKSSYESTWRSSMGSRLGPAAELYFSLIHSTWFMHWLAGITNLPYLLSDPKLKGGGLHESRPGSHFSVHRDFQFHNVTGLTNEMVLITYLNKDWQPEWDAALELWDKARRHCVTRVEPDFGRTLLMPHSDVSFHGHPAPMKTPDGRLRQSVTAYYYSSPLAGRALTVEQHSVFFDTRLRDRAKNWARVCAPPILWRLGRKLTKAGTAAQVASTRRFNDGDESDALRANATSTRS